MKQYQIMKKMRPTFIALLKIKLIAEIEDSEVNVSGYSMISCNAENRKQKILFIIFVYL